MEGDFIEMIMKGKYFKQIQLNNDITIFTHYMKVMNLLQQNNCNIIQPQQEPLFIDYYKIYDYKRTDFKPTNIIHIKQNDYSHNLINLCRYLKKYGMNINLIFECYICKEYKNKLFINSLDIYTNKNLFIQMKNNYNTVCDCSKLNNIFHNHIIKNLQKDKSYIKYIEIIPFYNFEEHHYYMIDSLNTPIIIYIS